jgi:hypothetical protein
VYLQYVLKGIAGINDQVADNILLDEGLHCNWWRRVGNITVPQIQAKLTERNLDWHLNRYEEWDPTTGQKFSDNTPFISTTSGTVERDVFRMLNVIRPAFVTALQFATADYTQTGYIFYGYVFTLGRKAVELMEFAEEVRDILIYTGFLPYYREGEIVAKIYIPSVRLERYEKYDGAAALRDFEVGRRPRPLLPPRVNPKYQPPGKYANIRGLIE